MVQLATRPREEVSAEVDEELPTPQSDPQTTQTPSADSPSCNDVPLPSPAATATPRGPAGDSSASGTAQGSLPSASVGSTNTQVNSDLSLYIPSDETREHRHGADRSSDASFPAAAASSGNTAVSQPGHKDPREGLGAGCKDLASASFTSGKQAGATRQGEAATTMVYQTQFPMAFPGQGAAGHFVKAGQTDETDNCKENVSHGEASGTGAGSHERKADGDGTSQQVTHRPSSTQTPANSELATQSGPNDTDRGCILNSETATSENADSSMARNPVLNSLASTPNTASNMVRNSATFTPNTASNMVRNSATFTPNTASNMVRNSATFTPNTASNMVRNSATITPNTASNMLRNSVTSTPNTASNMLRNSATSTPNTASNMLRNSATSTPPNIAINMVRNSGASTLGTANSRVRNSASNAGAATPSSPNGMIGNSGMTSTRRTAGDTERNLPSSAGRARQGRGSGTAGNSSHADSATRSDTAEPVTDRSQISGTARSLPPRRSTRIMVARSQEERIPPIPQISSTAGVGPLAAARERQVVSVGPGDEEAYLQQIQEENDRLRERQLCRVCREQNVNTIFLPCGHLCTCSACASTVSRCIVCNFRVRATARVFLQ